MPRKWLTIGFVASALSISALIEHTFGLGYVTILSKTLDYYEKFLEVLAEQIGVNALAWSVVSYIAQWLSLDLHLYPHWKHFFVPMWAYFAADRRALWQADRKALSIFAIVGGGVIAFASSLGAATVTLNDPSRLAVIFSMMGFVAYDLATALFKATVYGFKGEAWWQSFIFLARKFALTSTLVGGAVICASWLLAQAGYGVSSIATFIAFVALIGLRDVSVSLWSVRCAEWRTMWEKLSNLAAWNAGLGLLGSLFAAATYFLGNVLLGLLGL